MTFTAILLPGRCILPYISQGKLFQEGSRLIYPIKLKMAKSETLHCFWRRGNRAMEAR